MNAYLEMTRMEFKLFLREFFAVFFTFAFPPLMLLMFGGIYGNKPTPLFGGHGTIDASIPAYMGLIMAVTGIMSLPITVTRYREKKILKRFQASPLNPMGVIFSQITVNFVMTVLGTLLLILVAVIFFNLHFSGNLLSVIFAFVLSTLSIFSFGFVFASVLPNTRTAMVVPNVVYFPMIFLSGATLPLELMPQTMQRIALVLPLTYAVKLMKGVWLGGSLYSYRSEIAVLFSLLIVCTVISALTFKWE